MLNYFPGDKCRDLAGNVVIGANEVSGIFRDPSADIEDVMEAFKYIGGMYEVLNRADKECDFTHISGGEYK